MKKTLAIILAITVLCFAQDGPEKLAVYVSGASDAGINKSLSSKLLIALTQSGRFAEIADPGSFQDEFAKGGKGGKGDMTQISQAAKKHGADYVCVVSMIEAFGAYSISARLIKIAGLQTVKSGSADRVLKSLEDLTAVSNELAKQLVLPVSSQPPTQPAAVAAVAPAQQYYAPPQPLAQPATAVAAAQQYLPPQPLAQPAAAVAAAQQYLPPQPLAQPAAAVATAQQYLPPQMSVPITAAAVAAAATAQGSSQPFSALAAPEYAQKQCAKTFNVNEIISKLKGFPNQLKDCSSKLAKEMALAAAPLPGFLKKSSGPAEKIEPKSYMKQCAVDGIKNELPQGFPYADKLVGSVDNFVQKIMNLASSASGELDPSKLMSTVSNMNIDGLLSEAKGMLANGECMVDEVYTPVAQTFDYRSVEDESSSSETKSGESMLSFGFRAGLDFSRIDIKHNVLGEGSFGYAFGMHLGMVLDIAMNEIFHIQPGLMYIRKGTSDYSDYNLQYYGSYLEGPIYDIAANYIEIPMLLSLKLSMFRFNAGPYLGVCLGTNDYRVTDLDFGLSAGLGIDIDMFYIGVLYDHGLKDMSGIEGSSFYSRTIGLNAGINL
jgi:TolB-like protein